jgi:uncharacterized protein YjbI with pentapeptide repeats
LEEGRSGPDELVTGFAAGTVLDRNTPADTPFTTRLISRHALEESNDRPGADFHDARLVDMDLRDANLEGANLSRVDLTETDLRGARLGGANLHAAYLTGAQLQGADLTDADLSGSYLIATNLDGANLTGANIERAVWDQATIWPHGYDHRAHAKH